MTMAITIRPGNELDYALFDCAFDGWQQAELDRYLEYRETFLPEATMGIDKKIGFNIAQQEAHWQYSNLYADISDASRGLLDEIPVHVLLGILPDDHTGTPARWAQFIDDESRNSYFETCLDVYNKIRSYGVLGDRYHALTVADWVNLREALTYLMWRYWIAVPKSFGERPAAVQEELDALIARCKTGEVR